MQKINPVERELRIDRTTRLILFFSLLISYTYFFPRWADWGQNARLNLTLAIVEKGSLSIDAYFGNSGDYAKFEGHYYSDKAPGPSFLGVPVYAAVRPILQSGPVQRVLDRLSSSAAFGDTLNKEGTGVNTEKLAFFISLVIVVFFVISIPAALLGVFFYSFLLDITGSRKWAVITTLIYSLATPAFTYAGAFHSHQLSAFLLFTSFFIVYRIRHKGISSGWFSLAGFLLAYALISEYPDFLIALAILFYSLDTIRKVSRSWKWVAAFILPGVIPGILLMGYNLAIFHTPLPVGYEYSELYTAEHSQGFISLTYPHLEALWGITFGSYRGLFYVAPILLLGVIGLVAWWQNGRFRAELYVCVWSFLSFMLFNSSSVMWDGGYGVGPRYLVPMLPFLAVGIGIALSRWGSSWITRLAAGTLSLISFLVVWVETIGGQSYPDYTQTPLWNYSIPYLLQGSVARNWGMVIGTRGVASLLPILIIIIIAGLILIWLPKFQRQR